MELREIAAFREVARRSSFSQAALQLGYVQSTVSAQVQSLERELGVRLFDRLARTVTLTAAGEALLPHAEGLLEESAAALAAVAAARAGEGELVGSITVSAPETLLTYRLPSVLSRFRAQHPAVVVRLRPTAIGRFRGDTRRAVASGNVDLAFVLDAPIVAPGFHAEPLVREAIAVIAGAEHPLGFAHRVSPADLAGEQLLLPEASDSGCAYRGQFERQLGGGNVNMDRALEFTSIEAVKQCVIAGMGVSVLAAVAVEADVAAGRLRRLAWSEPFDVRTQLVWNERHSIGPAMAAFIGVAREVLGAG